MSGKTQGVVRALLYFLYGRRRFGLSRGFFAILKVRTVWTVERKTVCALYRTVQYCLGTYGTYNVIHVHNGRTECVWS